MRSSRAASGSSAPPPAPPRPPARTSARAGEIRVGYIPWDEGIASTFLWKELLERRGFKVTTTQYAAAPLCTGLATGRLDFQTDSWLPTAHAEYWKKYGDKLDDLGKWYGPTSLELTVPSCVKDVNSLADLKDHASEFGGKIVGIEPSAGMMGMLKNKVLKEYGLDGTYDVVDGSTPAMLAELKRDCARKQPVVVTLWSPHWAYSDYDLKKLKDPRGAWGKGDGVHTLARRGFAADNPEVGAWLKDFSMTEKRLTGLEAQIQKAGKGREQDAVRTWPGQHPGPADAWAPVARAGADKQAAGDLTGPDRHPRGGCRRTSIDGRGAPPAPRSVRTPRCTAPPATARIRPTTERHGPRPGGNTDAPSRLEAGETRPARAAVALARTVGYGPPGVSGM